jgi:hypothetical protein
VLQAETGRRAGHRIWLGANQRALVGGTEWAEFAVPGDPQLADVQFVVESDYFHCRIRNLHVNRVLLVNGKETEERTLVNGDIVTAGTTRFSVGIQESAEAERRHVRELFKGIKAILVESPSPGGWEVFASLQIDPLWLQLGFPNPPATPASHADGSATVATRSAVLAPGTARPGTKNARPA